jgi:hypothetical protein
MCEGSSKWHWEKRMDFLVHLVDDNLVIVMRIKKILPTLMIKKAKTRLKLFLEIKAKFPKQDSRTWKKKNREG